MSETSAPHTGDKPESSGPSHQSYFQHVGEILPEVLQEIADAANKCHHSVGRGLRRAA